jgi:hypothetical protein
MFRMLALASLAAACGGSAAAQAAWVAAPTVADMAAAYPEKAKAAGVGGEVQLACTTARNGAMTACDIAVETPRGYGFGAAARKIAERQMRAGGVARDTPLQVMISFTPEMVSGGPVVAKTPRWAALPSVPELQAVLPKTEGGPNDILVVMVCGVAEGGVLSDCAVDREEPAGQGFGAAILALAPKFRVDLMSAEGVPTVGARVRAPVRFALKPTGQPGR